MVKEQDKDELLVEECGDVYDAFFAAPTSEATAKVARSAVTAKAGGDDGNKDDDIEAEYAMLSQAHPASASSSKTARARSRSKSPGLGGAAVFAMDDDSDSDVVEAEPIESEWHKDCRLPEIPEPSPDFTDEDLALRQALVDFYLRHRADNLAHLNVIVRKYRGRNVRDLWAQLAVKYNLSAMEALEHLSNTMYLDAPFEYSDDGQAALLEEQFATHQAAVAHKPTAVGDEADGVSEPPKVRLFRRLIERSDVDGSGDILRLLCFRGIPTEFGELRSQVWKSLLGYLPAANRSEWGVLQTEKRNLYTKSKNEVLLVTASFGLEVRVKGPEVTEALDILQQIQKDIDRTRPELGYSRKAGPRCALVSLLFVYAQRNPDVRYVQGMNELAAVIFHVMSEDCSSLDAAEADTFWCLTALMAEIKCAFIQSLDNSSEGIQARVASVDQLLRAYDPDLARHLQQNGHPQFPLVFRWCTCLFAQEWELQDVLRIWDSFLADPQRFGFVLHVCCAAMLTRRAELLQAEDSCALAEVLARKPRAGGIDNEVVNILRLSRAVCAFERRSQAPIFPAKTARQIASDLSEWAQNAAARAQEMLPAEVTRKIQFEIAPAVKGKVQQIAPAVTRTIQENVAPAVQEIAPAVTRRIQEHIGPAATEKAGQASTAAVNVAQDGAQAVNAWLEETAPTRREAVKKAQTTVKSVWQVVRDNF